MPTLRQRALAELFSNDTKGLSRAHREAAVRAQGRRLLARYHPDRNPGNPEAEALFKTVVGLLGELSQLLPIDPPRAVSATFYPPSHPGGSRIYVEAHEAIERPRRDPRRGYDARRGILLRPR